MPLVLLSRDFPLQVSTYLKLKALTMTTYSPLAVLFIVVYLTCSVAWSEFIEFPMDTSHDPDIKSILQKHGVDIKNIKEELTRNEKLYLEMREKLDTVGLPKNSNATTCGDNSWSVLLPGTCYKVIDVLQTMAEAEELCRREVPEGKPQQLLSIGSQPKMDAIIDHVLPTLSRKSIATVWIRILPDTKYTNTSLRLPLQRPGRNCTELRNVEKGELLEASCIWKNAVVCEKHTPLTLPEFINSQMELAEQFNRFETIVTNKIKQLENNQYTSDSNRRAKELHNSDQFKSLERNVKNEIRKLDDKYEAPAKLASETTSKLDRVLNMTAIGFNINQPESISNWPKSGCPMGKFFCYSGLPSPSASQQCIPLSQACDGESDCKDGEDENNCSICRGLSVRCVYSDKCILSNKVCNDVKDCPDGEDEHNCPGKSSQLHPTRQVDSKNSSCPSGYIRCHESDKPRIGFRQCIQQHERDDGVRDCENGEDERDEEGFRCKTSTKIIPSSLVCDLNRDCPDGGDETSCDSDETWTTTCVGNGRKIPLRFVCDGDDDCGDGSDEKGCPHKCRMKCGDRQELDECCVQYGFKNGVCAYGNFGTCRR